MNNDSGKDKLISLTEADARVAAVVEQAAQHRYCADEHDDDDLTICVCGHQYNGEGSIDPMYQWQQHIRSLAKQDALAAFEQRVRLEEAEWWLERWANPRTHDGAIEANARIAAMRGESGT